MKWTRRRFNPNTLRIEQVPLTRKEIVRGVVVRLFSVVAIGATSVWLFDQVFQSPADRARDREIAFLEGQLESMRGDVAMMEAAMEDMAHRDDAVYRTLLGVQPVPEHLRNPGYRRGRPAHQHPRARPHRGSGGFENPNRSPPTLDGRPIEIARRSDGHGPGI